MTKEVEMGRGLSRNSIDELIGASKKKEEEKEKLQREVNRMEMESMKQSTIMLKIMSERLVSRGSGGGSTVDDYSISEAELLMNRLRRKWKKGKRTREK